MENTVNKNRKMKKARIRDILKIIKFWCISFSFIIFHTLKNKQWHMIYVDFECGIDSKDRPIRKQLIAKRTCT